MSDVLSGLLEDLPGPDTASSVAVGIRASHVLRPQGAFMHLDRIAAWLAGWQATDRPAVERPHAVVFAADHGVAADGVSAYPAEVTAAMVDAVERGGATASVLAAHAGASIEVVDVGVGRPTGNLRTEPAMSPERLRSAVQAGVAAVEEVDADLLVFGEMGIGNTTAAAAVSAAVLGGTADDWVGPGTGVTDEALANKRAVVDEALARVGTVEPLEALRQLGGLEMAAIAGGVLGARRRRIPVLLDGFIMTASVLPLHAVASGAMDHCRAGHCSAEPGHRRQLDHLGMEPLLDLDLRLGEGSGALAAIPLVRMAAAAVVEVATFEEWGLA
ncbi:MAG: nicotinate-nucleotide--dimethylbenzimidazole phosphoribosyltransferase [Actinomycetota bacterium]